MNKTSYVGRFAPSPSGPLHFGSLVTALGSYLQAKSKQGQWLVRIEDIDPPRTVAGAAQIILQQLHTFGLHWDGPIIYQSQRTSLYQSYIDRWLEQGLAYYCQCTRREIKARGGIYDGHCRTLHLNAASQRAIRVHCPTPATGFFDQLRGWHPLKPALAHEDLVVRRSDGFYAYNLVVVIDDLDAGISEIVRGSDLLEPTARQCNMYRLLQAKEPDYLHLPLVRDNNGRKLSKQNHAPMLDPLHIQDQLHAALAFLNHPVPEIWKNESPARLLDKMASIWDCQRINWRDLN
ncbi:tRNA glutamyl-Q(34) synthetase GluQRS [Celerinatantimonas sp. YJH-8]|uniref:tRNA glutamyl-Q(34) synthetase GluQRS n=1 Tax=Celerinatantimonas sp. YJH-8 TaxID=3228714 RepID=UPI0038CAFBDD